jgi:hypothetical protein
MQGRLRACADGNNSFQLTTTDEFKTYTVRASKEEPRYLIESDKTDHMAMHKGAALKKLAKTAHPKKK